MKKVVISGYYGFGNSGDEAILKAIVRDLRDLDPSIHITALSQAPDITRKLYHIHAINRLNLLHIYTTIKNCDLLIFGGGSLLQDVTSTRSLWYYLTIIRIALRFRKKIMVYANGIGPIRHEQNKNRVKKIINHVDVITLREEDSLMPLKEMQINKPRILVTADPVLSSTPSGHERVIQIFKEENIPITENLAAINIRKWKTAVNLDTEIAKTADYMAKQHGITPVFIPMNLSDAELAESVRKKMKQPSYMLTAKYDPEDLMGIISQMKLVVAMRLHTLIYASISHIPMIGLIYDPKIVGYLEYVEQPAAGDVADLKAEQILEKVDYILGNYIQEKERMMKRMGVLKGKAKENARIAVELMNRRG